MQEYTQANVLTLVEIIHDKRDQDRVLLSLATSALIVIAVRGVTSKLLGEYQKGRDAFTMLKEQYFNAQS